MLILSVYLSLLNQVLMSSEDGFFSVCFRPNLNRTRFRLTSIRPRKNIVLTTAASFKLLNSLVKESFIKVFDILQLRWTIPFLIS